MCGIVGWVNMKDDISTQNFIIEKMAKSLYHRGPDNSGTWCSEHVLIGHRRLIVIDPSNGAQPMIISKNDNTYVLTYNGELYNTDEVRNLLKEKNYSFSGTSDTEVLLNAYIEWGNDCVEKFNGIFAFAIWDQNKQQLFMARDRFGVKPLFYFKDDNSLIFASELKALLCHPKIKPVVGKGSLSEILFLGPSRTPGHGIFKNVHELKPAHALTFDGETLITYKYWSLKSKVHTDNFYETTEKIRYLVTDAINKQLVSDVPLCTFLSGGLDSSAISAITAKNYRDNGQNPLHTYSINFTDNDKYFKSSKFQPSTDNSWIKLVSEHSNTIHHTISFGVEEQVDSLADALYARDLPGMADIDSSLWLFCREIKKDFVVALSGECADEIFGGYPWFFREDALTLNSFPWIKEDNDKIKILSPDLLSIMNPAQYLQKRYNETLEDMPRLEGEDYISSKRREMFYLNFNWFMLTLLERKDRMSMAHGLEVRVPFCDHRIVEYVWNIPWEMKIFDNLEKGILRKALTGILPFDVLYRKKNPYPKTYNPLYEKMVKERLNDLLNDSSSSILSLVNLKELKTMLNDTSNYTSPWYGQLMATPQLYAYLIQLELWFRKYKVQIV